MRKRVLSLFTVLSMLLTFIITSALAAETSADEIQLYYENGYICISNMPKDGAVLIVAQYNDNALEKVKAYEETDMEVYEDNCYRVNVEYEFEKSEIKAMLWNALGEMCALADASEFSTDWSMLDSGEEYAWLVSTSTDENNEMSVELYTQQGEAREFGFASSVEFWGSTDTEPCTLSKSDMQTALLSNAFIEDSSLNLPIKLVKYKLDDENKISGFYCAVDSESVEDSNALRISTTNLYDFVCGAGYSLNNVLIPDGIIEFNIPSTLDESFDNDIENYSVDTVDLKNYISSGVCGRYSVVGEFYGLNATVLINFQQESSFDEMSSAHDGPTVITAVSDFEAIGDDEKICELSANESGELFTLTTSKRTLLGDIRDEVWTSTNNGRGYYADTLWDYMENDNSPKGVFDIGDTLLTEGDLTIRYISVEKLYDHVVNGADYGIIGDRPNRSTSRVRYYFGEIENVEYASKPCIRIKDSSYNFFLDDADMVFDLVEIDKETKEVTVGTATLSDLVLFDETSQIGDYIFITSGSEGIINRVVVYRFKESGSQLQKHIQNEVEPIENLAYGEKYAWIMDMYTDADSNETVVKMYTQDNEELQLQFSSEVSYQNCDDDEYKILTQEEAEAMLGDALTNNTFLMSWSTPIRLVKYTLDEDGKIAQFHCAVDASATEDTSMLRMNPIDFFGTGLNNGGVGNYIINDDIIEFNVPSSIDTMSSSDLYNVGNVDSAYYAIAEKGSSRSYVVGDFVNGYDACVLIRFLPVEAISSFGDLDSASLNNIMVVDSVTSLSDEYSRYGISGYSCGERTEFNTSKSANAGQLSSSVWSSTNNGRNYVVESFWNVESEDALSDNMNQGDLIIYNDEGDLIARYISAVQVYEYLKNGTSCDILGDRANKSMARVYYYCEKMENAGRANSSYDYIVLNNIGTVFYTSRNVGYDLVELHDDGSVEISKAVGAETIKENDVVFIAGLSIDIASVVVYRLD